MAELLASEIVTNAIRATSEPIRLWVAVGEGAITIHVWDASPEMPARRDAGPDQEGGWGLLLVQTLSADWGYQERERGKVVWAVIGRVRPDWCTDQGRQAAPPGPPLEAGR